jgi:hypothetical protein
MPYVLQWERLSDAITRVMAADGLSKDQARADICRAIADGTVIIRGKLKRHTTRHFRASNTVLEGKDFHIPTEIKSEDLDWESSRPVKPWMVRHGAFKLSGSWDLAWIELFGPDVTDVLCPAGKRGVSAPPASSRKSSTRRSRPALERAGRAIEDLYPQGVPGQAAEPNTILCRRVGEMLKKERLVAVSDDTILRAAGRRK